MSGTQADMPQIANPSVPALYEDALVYETGSAITSTGALTAYSGAKTGRSPLDKRVVKEEGSEKDVWWGPVNKPMSPQVSTTSSPRPSTETFRQTSPRLQAFAHRDPDAVLCSKPRQMPRILHFSLTYLIACHVLLRVLYLTNSS